MKKKLILLAMFCASFIFFAPSLSAQSTNDQGDDFENPFRDADYPLTGGYKPSQSVFYAYLEQVITQELRLLRSSCPGINYQNMGNYSYNSEVVFLMNAIAQEIMAYNNDPRPVDPNMSVNEFF